MKAFVVLFLTYLALAHSEEIKEEDGVLALAEKINFEDDITANKLNKHTTADDEGPNVVVQKLTLVVEGRPDVDLDLTGDLSKLKNKPFTIKEGADYKLKITFKVKRGIVSWLRYFEAIYRKGIRVDKYSFVVGSHIAKAESNQFLTPLMDADFGYLARGRYTVKSKFGDDNGNIYLEWEWAYYIKTDWD